MSAIATTLETLPVPAPARGSFSIAGADDQTVRIEAGEYYFNTKARARRAMTDRLSGRARQVYACLELGTMGFQQELAVTMSGGKQRPLSPGDIGEQTGLSRQNVRLGLEELEDAGLAERRADDEAGLRKGHVRIYSWAIPRAPKVKNCSRARLQFPSSFPASWEPLKPLIKRLKLSFDSDFVVADDYIREGERIAQDYKEAEMVVVNFLKTVSALPPISTAYKEEITERTVERKIEESEDVEAFVPPAFSEESEWEKRVGRLVAEVPTYLPDDAIESTEEIEWEERVGRSVAEEPTYLPENEIKTPPPEPENLPETAEEIELLNILDRTGLAVPPDDPILAKFVALATAYSIPVISLCRAILDKCKQKAALGRRIFNAYALYDFLAKGDLRQWIAQHGREVEQDRRATREPEPEPEQTSDTGSIDEMRLGVEQALADPNISEQERNTYLGLLERMRTW